MDRRSLILAGAIAWSLAALNAGIHLANGDLLVPAGMAASGIGYVVVRRAMTRGRRQAAAVPVELRRG
jgi:hypothetical protein